MDDSATIPFEEITGELAVLGVYRQVFAVLAREAGAMILDASLVDVDESILASFAEAGPEGLTVEQVVAACRQHDEGRVRRRFEVLRDYRAIAKVNERPNELFHQAAFAPYVMLLFLRRLADSGGQSELHRLLTLEHLSVSADGAQMEDGRATAHRLTTVFRLLANQLANLASAAVVRRCGRTFRCCGATRHCCDRPTRYTEWCCRPGRSWNANAGRCGWRWRRTATRLMLRRAG
jgi:hypothetical protein